MTSIVLMKVSNNTDPVSQNLYRPGFISLYSGVAPGEANIVSLSIPFMKYLYLLSSG